MSNKIKYAKERTLKALKQENHFRGGNPGEEGRTERTVDSLDEKLQQLLIQAGCELFDTVVVYEYPHQLDGEIRSLDGRLMYDMWQFGD